MLGSSALVAAGLSIASGRGKQATDAFDGSGMAQFERGAQRDPDNADGHGAGGRQSTRRGLTLQASGPTLFARPGDRLDLTLQNRLDTPSNLHFHGLHVSPRGHGDNVFLDIPPGYDFRYNVQIPADHPSGLY